MKYKIPVSRPSITSVEKKWVNLALDENKISSIGGLTEIFEEKFAEKIGVKHCIAVNSGCSALFLALWALGIRKGDEVIVPDFTMVASANAVVQCGATPIFVDVEWDTCNINPKLIEEKLTEKTKIVMPVHIYGHPANMSKIFEVLRGKNIRVVEDAAEAHGAEFGGKRVGSFGLCGCFSFYANKIITCAEGGAITTNNDNLASDLRRLRAYYFPEVGHFWHEKLGWNLRLSSLNAAVGIGQLERWNELHEKRNKIAKYYDKYLEGLVEIPIEQDFVKRVNWYYFIKSSKRDDIEKALEENRIETRRGFIPMHMQPFLKQEGDFLVSERLMNEGMYLPTFPDLTIIEQDEIIKIIKSVL